MPQKINEDGYVRTIFTKEELDYASDVMRAASMGAEMQVLVDDKWVDIKDPWYHWDCCVYRPVVEPYKEHRYLTFLDKHLKDINGTRYYVTRVTPDSCEIVSKEGFKKILTYQEITEYRFVNNGEFCGNLKLKES